MPAEITVTGKIAEPRINTTQTGKRVCKLSIAATRRAKTQTGDWADDGAPLWIEASFWDRDADKVRDLSQGDTVTVAGTLAVEEYQGKQGPATKLVIRFPRFLGSIRKTVSGSQNQAPGAPTGSQWGQGSFDNTAPF